VVDVGDRGPVELHRRVQLRIDGIDALETHYTPPHAAAAWRQPTALGAGAAALGVPLVVHFSVVTLAAAVAVMLQTRAFASVTDEPVVDAPGSRSAWLEPRTIAIGCMVLAFTLAEGSANDWLALGLVDGYGAAHWVGVLGFASFVAAMTTGRFVGPADNAAEAAAHVEDLVHLLGGNCAALGDQLEDRLGLQGLGDLKASVKTQAQEVAEAARGDVGEAAHVDMGAQQLDDRPDVDLSGLEQDLPERATEGGVVQRDAVER